MVQYAVIFGEVDTIERALPSYLRDWQDEGVAGEAISVPPVIPRPGRQHGFFGRHLPGHDGICSVLMEMGVAGRYMGNTRVVVEIRNKDAASVAMHAFAEEHSCVVGFYYL